MRIRRLFFYLLVILIVLFSLAPFLWQLLSSLKETGELYSTPLTYIPAKFSLESYRGIISNPFFLRYFLNSVIVSLATTFICLVLATLAGYSLSRFKMRFKGGLQFLLLLACLFPQIIFLIPLYELMAKLKFINNPLALTLPYAAFSLPMAIWLLKGFLSTLPKEIEEQAMVDGFSRFEILRRIILPLARPALATCAILIFIGPFAWNEFMFALTFMVRDASRTVPVGIALLSGSSMYEVPWNHISAAVVITTLPLVIFVFLFQRRIVEGLTRGALK